MNTWDVAKNWKDLCERVKNLDCIKELYAKNVGHGEMPGMPREIISR
jgi:hypothetical protein